MSEYIRNPATGRTVKVTSRVGKKILGTFVDRQLGMTLIQSGGRKPTLQCSLCGTPGVNKSNCPLNPSAKFPSRFGHFNIVISAPSSCSLCGAQSVLKNTCPLNPSLTLLEMSPLRHPLALKKIVTSRDATSAGVSEQVYEKLQEFLLIKGKLSAKQYVKMYGHGESTHCNECSIDGTGKSGKYLQNNKVGKPFWSSSNKATRNCSSQRKQCQNARYRVKSDGPLVSDSPFPKYSEISPSKTSTGYLVQTDITGTHEYIIFNEDVIKKGNVMIFPVHNGMRVNKSRRYFSLQFDRLKPIRAVSFPHTKTETQRLLSNVAVVLYAEQEGTEKQYIVNLKDLDKSQVPVYKYTTVSDPLLTKVIKPLRSTPVAIVARPQLTVVDLVQL